MRLKQYVGLRLMRFEDLYSISAVYAISKTAINAINTEEYVAFIR